MEVTHGNSEWKTPEHVVNCVLEVLGVIDLDPAASPDLNIPATTHYTRETNGLVRDWVGSVYLNPPYGNEITAFMEKMSLEISAGRCTEIIVLVANRTDTKWFRHMWKLSVFCHLYGRLRFLDKNNIPVSGTQFSSVVGYYGPNEERFIDVFSRLGQCSRPVRR